MSDRRTEGGEFADDRHAYITGFLLGELNRLGLNVAPQFTEGGYSYKSKLLITLDIPLLGGRVLVPITVGWPSPPRQPLIKEADPELERLLGEGS